ncbi:hypothetical protein TNCV_2477981 [Trichonephila clavipes]|nr:hypothetical protein TNCV_2477981 [Trichonephila clavipes]
MAVSAVEKAFCVVEWNPQLLCKGNFDHDSENLQLEDLSNNGMKSLKLLRLLVQNQYLTRPELWRRGEITGEELYQINLTQWCNDPWSTVPISVYVALSAEVHEQMFRSDVLSEAKPQAFSSQASLVLIYRPSEGMKG